MPTVRINDKAPEGFKTVSLGNEELDLSSGSLETTDPDVVSNAASHPWLTVEINEDESYRAETLPTHIAPKDDILSSKNDVSFDVDEIRKVEEAKRSGAVEPVAIQAGLDQDEKVEVAGTAFTHAADDGDDTEEGKF